MKQEIEHALHPIIGLPMWDVGRAGDLQWFAFGLQRHVMQGTRKGSKLKTVSDYALHVQCSWRILGLNKIVVASRDRYYPAGDSSYIDLIDFDWDIPGANRCDEHISNLLKEWASNPMTVIAVESDSFGGFSILFNNGYKLDVFPDSSMNAENWRFFRPYTEEEHFVVTGNGIEN